MAPKRQGDGKAESKTKRGRPSSKTAPEAVPKPWLDSGANVGLSANVWAQHQEHVQVVLGHPCFTDALTSSPVGIATATAGDEDDGDAGGYMDVYNQDKALASLAKRGLYLCGINLLWADVFWMPAIKVPIVWSSVAELMNYHFKEPSSIPAGSLEVGITRQEIDAKDWGKPGTWKRVSAEEMVIAWFAAVARDINDGADDATIASWLNHMLSTPCTFCVLKKEIGWEIEQRRETQKVSETLSRTSVQRIWDVCSRRTSIGANCTAEDLFQVYSEQLTLSSRSEAVTQTFITRAFLIWDNGLCNAKVQDIVLRQESLREKSLFAHSMKLYTVVSKARTLENVIWCMELIEDSYILGNLTADKMNLADLEGRRTGSLVDGWVLKKRMLSFFLDELLPKKTYPWSARRPSGRSART